MFFPKPMSEVELIVPSKDLLAVTKALSGYGVFHQTDSNYPGGFGFFKYLAGNCWTVFCPGTSHSNLDATTGY
jgi:hypothetical protein